ncbi:hypothetical protein BH20VER3_BH20VER3_13760 [soil metagenome]
MSTSSSLPQIFVHNRQRQLTVDRLELERFARRALPLCASQGRAGLTTLEEVNVLLVSDRRIAKLHRRFMRIPGPTDVITFQHGEIFISLETAARQAEAERTSVEHELKLYLVHGLLHLQGLGDEDPANRRRMHKMQEEVVARLR